MKVTFLSIDESNSSEEELKYSLFFQGMNQEQKSLIRKSLMIFTEQ